MPRIVESRNDTWLQIDDENAELVILVDEAGKALSQLGRVEGIELARQLEDVHPSPTATGYRAQRPALSRAAGPQIQRRAFAAADVPAMIARIAPTATQRQARVVEERHLEVHPEHRRDERPGRSITETSVKSLRISFVWCSVRAIRTSNEATIEARGRAPPAP